MYKNSGLEWFGNIPAHWDVMPMKFLVEKIFSGGTPTTTNTDYWTDDSDSINWVSISDISKSNGYLTETSKKISKKGLVSKNLEIIPKGTLLLSIFASLGKTTTLGIDATVNQAIIGLLPNNKLHQKFLQYLFEDCERYINYFSSANTQENLNLTKIKDLIFPVPPISEQTKIANFLDQKTAQIDDIITKKEKLLLLLEEKKKAVINEAVTKGLNPNAKMKDSGIKWIGEIPENWEVKKLKYLLDFIESGCSVNAVDNPIENNSEYGVLKTSCVYNYYFEPNENKKILPEEYSRVKCPVKKNTIIVSRMNTPELVGASGYVEESNNNLFLPDRLWQLNFSQQFEKAVKFISVVLSSNIYRNLYSRISTGSSPSMQNISQISFADIEIILPPQDEINQILHKIEIFNFKVEEIKTRLSLQIEKLKEYRQSLISEAVTGKIDVKNYN